jgi:hypothetical protein
VTVDEAIGDLLEVSTDIRTLAVLGDDGAVLGVGPGGAGAELGAATEALWLGAAAALDDGAAAHDAALDHVVVDLGDAAVVVLESGGHRAVALTSADPPLGLVLFDLRTCLADAFPVDETADAVPDEAS